MLANTGPRPDAPSPVRLHASFAEVTIGVRKLAPPGIVDTLAEYEIPRRWKGGLQGSGSHPRKQTRSSTSWGIWSAELRYRHCKVAARAGKCLHFIRVGSGIQGVGRRYSRKGELECRKWEVAN